MEEQQIAGVVTAVGRVRVTKPDGSVCFVHLARATDPLRRPIPVFWGLEDLWFTAGMLVSRVRRLATRNREWRVEVTPSLTERPSCVAVGKDRAGAARLAAKWILEGGAWLDHDPWW